MPIVKIAGIDVEIIQKKMKYMHLYVLPPDGRVRLTAPCHARDGDMTRFVAAKLDWIYAKQHEISKRNAAPEKQFVSGEMHSLWGREYELIVVRASRSGVRLAGGVIQLRVGANAGCERREGIMNEWYRANLKAALPGLFEKWQKIIGVRANEFRIKNMRTRWGTCNTRDKRIWINLQLAKKPLDCLEYVVVHELVHLLERSHSHVFKGYMDQFLPNWRDVKKKLNGI